MMIILSSTVVHVQCLDISDVNFMTSVSMSMPIGFCDTASQLSLIFNSRQCVIDTIYSRLHVSLIIDFVCILKHK